MKRLTHVLFFLVGGLVLGCASPEPAPEPTPQAPEASPPAPQPAVEPAAEQVVQAALPEVRYYLVADG